jgi:hypothetical protein
MEVVGILNSYGVVLKAYAENLCVDLITKKPAGSTSSTSEGFLRSNFCPLSGKSGKLKICLLSQKRP